MSGSGREALPNVWEVLLDVQEVLPDAQEVLPYVWEFWKAIPDVRVRSEGQPGCPGVVRRRPGCP